MRGRGPRGDPAPSRPREEATGGSGPLSAALRSRGGQECKRTEEDASRVKCICRSFTQRGWHSLRALPVWARGGSGKRPASRQGCDSPPRGRRADALLATGKGGGHDGGPREGTRCAGSSARRPLHPALSACRRDDGRAAILLVSELLAKAVLHKALVSARARRARDSFTGAARSRAAGPKPVVVRPRVASSLSARGASRREDLPFGRPQTQPYCVSASSGILLGTPWLPQGAREALPLARAT